MNSIKQLLKNVILVDILTIGLGFTVLLSSIFEGGRPSQEGVTFGSSLLILGILIRLWRKENLLK
ncbi:MAG TPA: hypothetical protein VGF79_09595 [Bacteroidia bacterium]